MTSEAGSMMFHLPLDSLLVDIVLANVERGICLGLWGFIAR